MAQAILRVNGMTCQGCVRAITTAIGKAVPAAEVEVSLPENNVRIAQGDVAAIAAAVRAAGFDVEVDRPGT